MDKPESVDETVAQDAPRVLPRQGPDVGQIAAALGAFSALVFFLASLGGWAFARGVGSLIVLPTSANNLRTSLDFASSVIFQHVAALVASLLLGLVVGAHFSLSRRNEKAITQVLAFTSLGLFTLGEFTSGALYIFKDGVYWNSLLVPFWLGYTAAPTKRFSFWFPTLLIPMAFVLFVERNYSYGQDVADRIIHRTDLRPTGAEHGFAASKPTDFPIVTVSTNHELNTQVPVERLGTSYLYRSRDSTFLKLLTEDGSNYYLVENVRGEVRSFAVSKGAVLQMVYQWQPDKDQ